MFLSRVDLGPDAANHESFWREVTNPYGAHQALWKLLSRSRDQKRDFLFRPEEGRSRVGFMVLSSEPPRDDQNGLWSVDAKRFSPSLKAGQRLGFRLRASPVVTRQGTRHDVVMDRKRLLRGAGGGEVDEITIVRETGLAWLQRQGVKAGFKLAQADLEAIGDDGLLESEPIRTAAVRIDGYRQYRLRPREGDKHPIRFSTLDFEGELEVVDPLIFLAKVKSGFGPQKAFGCGLMLLRRS